MELNLFEAKNGYLEVAAVLPFDSVVYELKYRESGAFQAVFPRTASVEKAVKVGTFANISVNPAHSLMYIHTVKKSPDEIWAYGYEAKELLNKREMLGTGVEPAAGDTSAVDMLNTAINALYGYSWATTPAEINGISGEIDPAGIEYSSLLDFVFAICEKNNAGLMLYRDPYARKGVIKIYPGVDRSADVLFSKTFGTLRDYTAIDSDVNYVNKVRAIGSEGVTIVDVEPNLSGEIYSLVLDLRAEFPRDPDEMSMEEYVNALSTRAALQRIAQGREHKFDVSALDARDYGTTYGLGDIVGVYDDQAHVAVNHRIAAVKFKLENNAIKTEIELEAIT